MVGNGGDGRTELNAQLLGLAVLDAAGVFKDGGNELVDRIRGDIVADEDDCCNGDGLDVVGSAVGVSGDDAARVVGGGGEQGVHVLVVDADEVDAAGGRKVGDGGGGCAGDDECRVDLAVLQALSAVAEALVNGGDVLLCVYAVHAEHVDCVEVNAGAESADGNGLALEILNGLDVGVGGDDLDLLHVQRRRDGEAVDCAGLGEEVGAGVGVAHNVGLAEAELHGAGVEVFNVGLRAVADDRGDFDVGIVGDVLSQNAAEGVIGAGFTAGSKGQTFAAAAAAPAGAQREDYTYNKQHSNKFFHFVYLRNMSLRRGEMYNYLATHALHYALVCVYNTTKSLTLQ